MTALLEVAEISKVYELETRLLPLLLGRRQKHIAVDRVSFSVPRGGVLGVVGESGCGKSTLARMILRLEPPSGGRIWFDGEDVTALSGAALNRVRKRTQMVFQDPGGSLNPRKPVRRVLRESLALGGLPKGGRDDAAAALLEQVGLGAGLLHHYPHELSGGQRQRVAIARALAMQPDLIVADEPVSALDVSLQAQIIHLLLRLRDELRLTLVFISHDLALVHHICNEVIVMQAGRIVERGAPANVLHDPQHPYTKLLLDAVPRAPHAMAR
jgi:peptide/nickel transport system ATP-binding protein